MEPHRVRLTLGVFVVLVLAVAAVEAIGYFAPPAQRGGPPVTLVSSIFGVYPQGSNMTAYSGMLWVENTGTKPIVSLAGSVPTLPRMSLSPKTLYPNELGSFVMYFVRQGDGADYASGTQHVLTMNATFSDGTSAIISANFTSSECGSGAGVGFLTLSYGSYGVDNSSGMASWQLFAQTNTTLPVVAVTVGVNNGTLWFPFQLLGKPISGTNPLSSGTVATQTFTWKVEPHTFESTQWVGECANQNGQSTAKITS